MRLFSPRIRGLKLSLPNVRFSSRLLPQPRSRIRDLGFLFGGYFAAEKEIKRWRGVAHLFRPTYADANMGHPSRARLLEVHPPRAKSRSRDLGFLFGGYFAAEKEIKRWRGVAHLFRPTYADANMGHPSRARLLEVHPPRARSRSRDLGFLFGGYFFYPVPKGRLNPELRFSAVPIGTNSFSMSPPRTDVLG